jgi:hypothetical protein
VVHLILRVLRPRDAVVREDPLSYRVGHVPPVFSPFGLTDRWSPVTGPRHARRDGEVRCAWARAMLANPRMKTPARSRCFT